MGKWTNLLMWAILCSATIYYATADSGNACSCSGVISRSLDCSNRGRSAFTSSDLCSGRTTKVDLSRNAFTSFPTTMGSHVVKVNISRNQLTVMPRAPPLNSGTTSLDVSENRISQASNELRSLGSLKRLFCNGNQLQSLSFLPEPCALQTLLADHNRIRSVSGPLNTCSELKFLDLSFNQLALTRGAFAGLRNLEELRLVHAGIATLNGGEFEGLPELEKLDMSENTLSAIQSPAFSSLTELETLSLNGNNIDTLVGNAFVGLRELELLKIAKNKLTTIPHGVFASLIKLKTLDLSENQINSLPPGSFSGLQTIESILLTSNLLQAVPSRLFAGIRSLKKVYLEQNRLATVPPDMLAGIDSMEMIDLSHNLLTSLPPGLFQEMNSVKHLDLSFNRFTAVSGRDFSGLLSIERLDFMYNQFTVLPTYAETWPQVTTAFFGHNNIAELNEGVVRSWLGNGDKKRLVNLGSAPLIRTPASLRWALQDGSISTSVAENCQCGGLKRDDAEIQFCVAVSCPGTKASWVEAVRSA